MRLQCTYTPGPHSGPRGLKQDRSLGGQGPAAVKTSVQNQMPTKLSYTLICVMKYEMMVLAGM